MYYVFLCIMYYVLCIIMCYYYFKVMAGVEQLVNTPINRVSKKYFLFFTSFCLSSFLLSIYPFIHSFITLFISFVLSFLSFHL